MEASALRQRAMSRPAPRPRGVLLRLRSDEQLLALMRAGDADAFATIAARYEPRLLAYVRRMLGGAAADAEDVVQDVLLSAYRTLAASERPIAVKPWLYRVAHNRAIDHLRRPAPELGEIYAVNRTADGDPAEQTERRERLLRLVAAIGELPDQQRSALLLREMEGLSYADVAVALDTTVPAVKSLLVRARMGLVEHQEAESAECAEVRSSLLDAYRRGVRMSGLARRHVAGCDGCRSYHRELRDTDRALAALAGGGPFAALAKLFGLGGAGGAAGAAGGLSGGVVAGGACAAATCGLGTFAAVSGKGLAVLSAAAVLGAPAHADRPAAAKPAQHVPRKTHATPAVATPVAAPLAAVRQLRMAIAGDGKAERRQVGRSPWRAAGHSIVGSIVVPASTPAAAGPDETAPTVTTTPATTTTSTTATTTSTNTNTSTAAGVTTPATAPTTTPAASAAAALTGGAQPVAVTPTPGSAPTH